MSLSSRQGSIPFAVVRGSKAATGAKDGFAMVRMKKGQTMQV
jgi:hypothetical protein